METLARDLLTDADERAFLDARETRIAEPLPVPGLAALRRLLARRVARAGGFGGQTGQTGQTDRADRAASGRVVRTG